LEINATGRGNCRTDQQNAFIAVFFGYFCWNTSAPAHNIR
jgi:hypothetical protein